MSVPLWFPQAQHRLDALEDSRFTSLPQIAFCLWLGAARSACQGAHQDPRDDDAPKRFGRMAWGIAGRRAHRGCRAGRCWSSAAGIDAARSAPASLASSLARGDVALVWLTVPEYSARARRPGLRPQERGPLA